MTAKAHTRTASLLTMLVTTAIACCGASAASAAIVHPFLFSFDGGTTPAGGFSPVGGLVVDNSASASSGDVYVSDESHSVVDRYSASGGYICQITGAGSLSTSPSECNTSVSGVPGGAFTSAPGQGSTDATGDLYAPDGFAHAVEKFSSVGAYLSRIELPENGFPMATATDASNNVLIADNEHGAVDKFESLTNALSVFANKTPSGQLGAPFGVAVDNDPASPAHGHVYVGDKANRAVDVFDAAGGYLTQLTGTPNGAFPSVSRVAVDPATGHVYVAAENAVDEFGPMGTFLTETRIPNEGTTSSVAINAKSGDIYTGDSSSGKVDVFGPATTAPDVSTTGTPSLAPTAATIHGHIDPAGGGNVTSCNVEYGTTTAYGEAKPCSPMPPYATPTDVSAAITSLTPDTAYHFRIVVADANGANHSEDATFTTTGPPVISEESVVAITRHTGTLQAQVNAHGFATTYHFEYGTAASYGTTVPMPDGDVGSDAANHTVTGEIGGLSLNTTYHYRVVATSSQGVIDGPDNTFTTRPVANVESQSWIAGPREATLKAKVEDFGAPTACEVEYVTEAEFVSSGYTTRTDVQCSPTQLGGTEGELHAIARPKSLDATTTYHFRFLLSNQYGQQRTPDQKFTTFGLRSFSLEDLEREGMPYTQAGGHPYELTVDVHLNTTTDHIGNVAPSGTLKDVRVQLPPGLIGNPQATPKCTRYDSERYQCSGDSQVGVIVITTAAEHGTEPVEAPIYNLTAPAGVAAEFTARFNSFVNAFIDASVRTGSDYGVDAASLNITTLDTITAIRVTMWGVPADPSHDAKRRCPFPDGGHQIGYQPPPCSISAPQRPFLTNPTSCSGPLTTTALVDSYQAPDEFVRTSVDGPGITGCERLHFTPTIAVTPESTSADTPTGLEVDLHVPQEENPRGLTEADLKDATVTLPRGLTVNPSSANGLVGCSEAQIELKGPNAATCPSASKIGAVEINTPLTDHPLKGGVYVAMQGNAGPARGSNPFGSLLAIYIAVDDPATGVVVKLAGKVSTDPLTGQLTTTFDENPQLPFEDLRLDFFGGPLAALSTPAACGTDTTTTSLTPWSANAPASPSSSFNVVSGPGGSPCANPQPFSPSLNAGSTNAQAGAFTPFTTTFSRDDGNQNLAQITLHLPPGLLGKLASVEPCGEQQASLGTCGSASDIGHTLVSVGLGPDPYMITGGKVFITGPYKGAPYGLSIAEPAKAGPFDLGTGPCDCVAVRAKIEIDPHTAALTIISDPLPTILQGIPVQLKHFNVAVDRPGFTFNPTNCSQLAITATITSEQGATAASTVPFEVANCATLPFKPTFTVLTLAKTSKANGAYLHVKVTSGPGQANIGKVKVDLPKQLPSRLTTLQKACTAAVFEGNPAACPAASVVGTGTAVTPVLKNALTGPAYLVSHGGAAFPDLVVVLQGEGITLDLVGNTDIKKGITSSTFKAVPDAPISTFDLVLPEGPHSVLTAYGRLCNATKAVSVRRRVARRVHGRTVHVLRTVKRVISEPLSMPTAITGQNGAVIKQTTKIAVSGCPKHKKAKPRKKSEGKKR